MRTQIIKPDEITYFRIFFHNFVRRAWWRFLFLWAVTILITIQNFDSFFTLFAIAISIVLPMAIIWYMWKYSRSPENKIFYLSRYYDISDDKITGYMSDGTISEFKYENFIRLYNAENYVLLYLSKSSFLYIPKNSFQNEHDLRFFMKIMKTKLKMK